MVLALGAFGGAGTLVTALALTVTTPATEGCQTHQCDPSTLTIGVANDGGIVGTGEVIQRDDQTITWESVPMVPTPDGSTWTNYSGNETITFVYGPEAGIPENATVLGAWCWVAAGSDVEANFTNCAGQLGEYSNVSTAAISVLNQTCQGYYLRVVAEFALPDAGAAQSENLSPGVTPTGEVEAAAVAGD